MNRQLHAVSIMCLCFTVVLANDSYASSPGSDDVPHPFEKTLHKPSTVSLWVRGQEITDSKLFVRFDGQDLFIGGVSVFDHFMEEAEAEKEREGYIRALGEVPEFKRLLSQGHEPRDAADGFDQLVATVIQKAQIQAESNGVDEAIAELQSSEHIESVTLRSPEVEIKWKGMRHSIYYWLGPGQDPALLSAKTETPYETAVRIATKLERRLAWKSKEMVFVVDKKGIPNTFSGTHAVKVRAQLERLARGETIGSGPLKPSNSVVREFKQKNPQIQFQKESSGNLTAPQTEQSSNSALVLLPISFATAWSDASVAVDCRDDEYDNILNGLTSRYDASIFDTEVVTSSSDVTFDQLFSVPDYDHVLFLTYKAVTESDGLMGPYVEFFDNVSAADNRLAQLIDPDGPYQFSNEAGAFGEVIIRDFGSSGPDGFANTWGIRVRGGLSPLEGPIHRMPEFPVGHPSFVSNRDSEVDPWGGCAFAVNSTAASSRCNTLEALYLFAGGLINTGPPDELADTLPAPANPDCMELFDWLKGNNPDAVFRAYGVTENQAWTDVTLSQSSRLELLWKRDHRSPPKTIWAESTRDYKGTKTVSVPIGQVNGLLQWREVSLRGKVSSSDWISPAKERPMFSPIRSRYLTSEEYCLPVCPEDNPGATCHVAVYSTDACLLDEHMDSLERMGYTVRGYCGTGELADIQGWAETVYLDNLAACQSSGGTCPPSFDPDADYFLPPTLAIVGDPYPGGSFSIPTFDDPRNPNQEANVGCSLDPSASSFCYDLDICGDIDGDDWPDMPVYLLPAETTSEVEAQAAIAERYDNYAFDVAAVSVEASYYNIDDGTYEAYPLAAYGLETFHNALSIEGMPHQILRQSEIVNYPHDTQDEMFSTFVSTLQERQSLLLGMVGNQGTYSWIWPGSMEFWGTCEDFWSDNFPTAQSMVALLPSCSILRPTTTPICNKAYAGLFAPEDKTGLAFVVGQFNGAYDLEYASFMRALGEEYSEAPVGTPWPNIVFNAKNRAVQERPHLRTMLRSVGSIGSMVRKLPSPHIGISNVNYTVDKGTVTFSWDTDTSSSTILCIQNGNNFDCPPDTSVENSHVATIQNLQTETLYYFKVKSCRDGYCEESTSYAVTTGSDGNDDDPPDFDFGGAPKPGVHVLGPNPSSGPFRMRYISEVNDYLRISIFNVSGQLIRDLATGTFEAGVHEAIWDGLSDNGLPAPSGKYFVRMVGRNHSYSTGIVLTR